jgi:glucuronokinase
MIIRKTAYPRAGLIGNPSDGYYGKTIAFAFQNFQAEVTLYESPELEIQPNVRDHSRFMSVQALADDVRRYGYYGGIRLLKATVKVFYDYCVAHGIQMHDGNFVLRYASTIPHLVGLAGSSAIITACLRALMAFYGVTIPRPLQANLVLSVEKDELGISGGLQDRVAQVYQGLVYMNFDRGLMEAQGYGAYEELSPGLLPNLYIAYREDLSGGSEIVHNDLKERFARREPELLQGVEFWKQLTDEVRACLLRGERERIGALMNANFDRRAQLCRISPGNLRMIEAARSAGASAKFTGSGGAIIGTYEDEAMYAALKSGLEPLSIRVFKPVVAPPTGEDA